MVSRLEAKIRAMDNENVSLEVSMRCIVKKLKTNQKTCRSYLSAKRRGFLSYRFYLNHTRKVWEHYKEEEQFPEILATDEELDRRASMELNPYKVAERADLLNRVAHFLKSRVLNRLEKYVIKNLYFKERTFRVLAKEKGVSQTEILWIEKKALEKIRYAFIREGVHDCN
jgi:DNA-directed RNA polymerase specialized sigma subunit